MSVKTYLIATPEGSMTFIGQLQPSLTPGMVRLCSPGGHPVFELPAEYVTESSREELAQRLLADKRAERARWN